MLKNYKEEDLIKFFNPGKWKDMGVYFTNISQQGSIEWLMEKAIRDTSSEMAALVGKSNFKTPKFHATTKIDPTKKYNFSKSSELHMRRGRELEPIAREWYEKKYNVTVEESGLSVPKWNITIGASPDGMVGEDGLIEIKCPERMYSQIINYKLMLEYGFIPDKYYSGAILNEHYCQIQMAMAVLNREWCDYIVYCRDSNEVFVYKVYFNKNFWHEIYNIREKYITTIFLDELKEYMKNITCNNEIIEIKARLFLFSITYPEVKSILDLYK